MKKMILSVLFLAVFSPLFAQTSKHYEKFQGIWHGGFEDDKKFILVFVNSTFMMKTDNYTI
jgi:hypothetical protein